LLLLACAAVSRFHLTVSCVVVVVVEEEEEKEEVEAIAVR
jgi:hypothetical protein